MEISPLIHRLPNELLVKIIDKLPRTQWPALELIDHKFRDAVLLAWGSVREVDMERDFLWNRDSKSKPIKGDNDHDPEMVKGRLRRQIARQTEAVLKNLSERSPFITSLSGLSLITDDPNLNTTAVQNLSGFEHLETIKFATKRFSGRIVNGGEIRFWCDIPLINLVEFIESTQSRATLKVISIDQCRIPVDPILVASFDQRLRAAFANVSNDQTLKLLRLESFSMRMIGVNYPLTFFDGIDASKLAKLSLGDSHVHPAALANLINGAPQLRHLDFAFLESCSFYDNTIACQGGRLQPNKDLLVALESHPNLTSLGFNRIWDWNDEHCECHRFEAEFKTLLRTIGPKLVNFVFKPEFFPPNIRLGEIRDIIQRHMPRLKSITLDKCCAENPEELRGIADGKKLEEIKVASYTFSNYNDNYKSILNDVLSTIINKSTGLKRFNGIEYYPDQRVTVELCKLSDLIDLRIRADQLTVENFVAFSQQVFAEKLQVLHLGRIGRGVEPGLIELIAKASQLRELVVHKNVTDRLLDCLAESCPKLEKLCALSVDGMTFDSLQMLVDRCSNLRWIHVENADGTLSNSLTNLALERYRRLELN